jgi:hypothetical protein
MKRLFFLTTLVFATSLSAQSPKMGLYSFEGKKLLPCDYDLVSAMPHNMYRVLVDGKYGIVDAAGKPLLAIEYENVRFFSRQAAIVTVDGKDGIVSLTTGRTIIEPRYDYIGSPVPEGYAAVSIEGKWGAINLKGKEVVKCRYAYINRFYPACFVATDSAQWQALLGYDGKTIIPFKYNEITPYPESGVAVVKRERHYGLVSIKPATAGKEILPCAYDQMNPPYKGVMVTRLNMAWGLTSITGNEVLNNQYEYVSEFTGKFARVCQQHRWGVVNLQGKTVIPVQYNYLSDITPQGYLTIINDMSLYGVVNLNLSDPLKTPLVPFEYPQLRDVSENLLAARTLDKGWGVMNLKQKIITQKGYSTIGNYHQGRAIACQGATNYGVLDSLGNEISSFKYQEIGDYVYQAAIAKISEGKVLLGKDGKQISDIYESIAATPPYLFIVQKQGKYGVINNKGDELVPCLFEQVTVNADNKTITVQLAQLPSYR